MSTFIKKLEYLEKKEKEFNNEFNNKLPLILADIKLSKKDLNEIGKALGTVIQRVDEKNLEKYSLTISLFLVWTQVYYYVDGNVWEPIFKKLLLTDNQKIVQNLGEIFLKVLEQYNLLKAPQGSQKKYMIPMLMHGYISEHYALPFLDYLNTIYLSYLNYDLSKENLSRMWEEVFNIGKVEAGFKNTLTELEDKEKILKQEICKLQIPSEIDSNSLELLEDYKKKIVSCKKDLESYEENYLTLEKEKLSFDIHLNLFISSKQNFGNIKMTNFDHKNRLLRQVNTLFEKVEKELSRQQKQILSSVENIVEKKCECQNRLEIFESKRKALQVQLVKLGDGDLVKGYEILKKYNQLNQELKEVIEKQNRFKKLYVNKEKLGAHTSLQQILTISLRSLAEANVDLFQKFIESTLKLIEARAKGEEVGDRHHLEDIIEMWFKSYKIREKNQTIQNTSIVKQEKEKIQEVSKSWVTNTRYKLIKPKLKYNFSEKQIQLVLPCQELIAPKGFVNGPEYILYYETNKEVISCRYSSKGNRITTNEHFENIERSDFKGIAFKWFTIYDYWDLSLEEIIVFSKNGTQLNGREFKNGFYYILANENLRTDNKSIIDERPSFLIGYKVYEYLGQENILEFYGTDKKNISLYFSQKDDIELNDLTYFPGLSHGEMPVCHGKPVLSIKKRFLTDFGKNFFITIKYNDMDVYNEKLENFLTAWDNCEGEVSCLLPLNGIDIVSNFQTWQIFDIKIFNNMKEDYFHKKFCLVKNLNISLKKGILEIETPFRIELNGEKIKCEKDVYNLPISEKELIDFDIYFDKIGLKSFSLKLPSITWGILQDGKLIDKDILVLLKSESHLLKTYNLTIEDLNSHVNTITLFDNQEKLIQRFNLKGSKQNISLEDMKNVVDNSEDDLSIMLLCGGLLGDRNPYLVAKIYKYIEIDNVELSWTEKEESYLLNLSFETHYCNS